MTEADQEARARRWEVATPWLVGLVCAVVAFTYFLRWNVDDGMIVAKVVRNILQGRGWCFNAGDGLNASTSALNVIVTSLLALVVPDVSLAQHLVGAVAIGWTAATLFSLLRDRDAHPLIAACAAAVVSVYQGANQSWGLEANLFFALLLAVVLAESRRRPTWPLLPLVVLARPDGVILVALVLLGRLIQKREWLRDAAALTIVLGAWLVFSRLSFGQFLPSTLAVKVWQGRSGLWGTGPVYVLGYLKLAKGKLIVAALTWILGAVGAWLAVRSRHPVLLLLAAVVVQQVAYALMNVPAYGWYYIAFDSTLMVLGAFAVGRLGQGGNPPGRWAGLSVALALLVSLGGVAATRHPKTNVRDVNYEAGIKQMDAKVADRKPVVVLEVGTIGYWTDRAIVDMCALTSRNPEYVSGANCGQFFKALYPYVLFREPLNPMEAALAADPRFDLLYFQTGLVGPPSDMRLFALREGVAYPTDEALKREVLGRFEPVRRVPSGSVDMASDGVRSNLDQLNGSLAPRRGDGLRRGWLYVRGWLADGAGGVEADGAMLLSDGQAYFVEGSRAHRPDVQGAVRGAAADSGIVARGSTYDVPPGPYTLCLARKRSGRYLAWPVMKVMLN